MKKNISKMKKIILENLKIISKMKNYFKNEKIILENLTFR